MSPRNQDGESCFQVFHGPQTLSPPQDGWDSILRKRPRGLVPSAPSFVFELVDFVGDRSLRIGSGATAPGDLCVFTFEVLRKTYVTNALPSSWPSSNQSTSVKPDLHATDDAGCRSPERRLSKPARLLRSFVQWPAIRVP